jgi:hypothetical protein
VRHLLAAYDLSTKTDARVGEWARANNVELASTPHSASWRNRIQAQDTALRHVASTAPTTTYDEAAGDPAVRAQTRRPGPLRP